MRKKCENKNYRGSRIDSRTIKSAQFEIGFFKNFTNTTAIYITIFIKNKNGEKTWKNPGKRKT